MFYLKRILSSEASNTENIIRILFARGFLIEDIEGKYYLSDNASVSDAEYLERGLKKYQIGKIIKHSQNEKVIRSYTNGKFEYERIKRKQIEVCIYDDVCIDNAIDFFNEGNRVGGESVSGVMGWGKYVYEKLDEKPPINCIESYIALYCKAISACGVFTCGSCDGNHVGGGRINVNSLYPSSIFHEYVWKHIVCSKFGNIPFIEDGIDINEGNKEEIYYTVYCIACYLYENREYIRKIKEETVSFLTKRVRKKQDGIEQFYRGKCDEIFKK